MPITTLLTPAGRGAVATIAFRGPVQLIDDANLFRAANGRPLAEQSIDRVVFGRWGAEPGEELVLCRSSSEALAIHCHGGHAASEAILDALVRLGCERLDRWDYIERTEGIFQREAAHALAHAPTPRTAAIIAHQVAGPLRTALDELASETISPGRMEQQIERLLQQAAFGRHLIEPWQVVLFGRPNVGKSSLMNALTGFERAIVLDAPGTTRDLVTAEIALDGWPIRLTDTAGLRSDADELEASGIDRAREHLTRADLRILVLDRGVPPTTEELAMLEESAEAIVVANKQDLEDAWNDALPREAISLSAKTSEGLDRLSAAIVNRLVPAMPAQESPVPISFRQIEILTNARLALRNKQEQNARRLCQSLTR